MEKAQVFFEKFIGNKAQTFFQLPVSGSSRQNFIAEYNQKKYIVTYNSNIEENKSFFYFSNVFTSLDLNTPKILSISEDEKLYIQEFLGDETLSEKLERDGLSNEVKQIVEKSLQNLFLLQNKTEGMIDYSKCFEYEIYDEFPVYNDLNYFKFLFVDVLEIPYHKGNILKEFKKLTELISNLKPKSLMLRDFQSRNIMVNENFPYFIDYQSSMLGPRMYDVISLLYQAKANFPDDFKDEMMQYYLNLHNDEHTVYELKKSIMPIRLIRGLQVLGAYGFRGIIQQKNHFISSITKALVNLNSIAETWELMSNFPELNKLIKHLNSEEIQNRIDQNLNK